MCSQPQAQGFTCLCPLAFLKTHRHKQWRTAVTWFSLPSKWLVSLNPYFNSHMSISWHFPPGLGFSKCTIEILVVMSDFQMKPGHFVSRYETPDRTESAVLADFLWQEERVAASLLPRRREVQVPARPTLTPKEGPPPAYCWGGKVPAAHMATLRCSCCD